MESRRRVRRFRCRCRERKGQMQTVRNLHLLRRFALLCAALVISQVIVLAQPTIIGPTTGAPGQTLSYQLQDQGKPVAGVTWTQGLNPDRYSGNDYATSLDLRSEEHTS